MRYALFIGLRYLRAKRRDAFVSLITVIATAGVAIGVLTLDVVLSVMTGFEEDLRDRILGFNPHVLVTSYTGLVRDYPEVLKRVRSVPDVVAVEPFVYGQVMLSSSDDVAGALVRGIEPVPNGAIDFRKHLQEGHLADLASEHPLPPEAGLEGVKLPGIILGKDLARQLGVTPGDPINMVSPVGIPTAIGLVPRVKRFVVVGIFESGMAEHDSALAYVELHAAQRFFEIGDRVTGLEVRVDDLYRARAVAEHISKRLGFPYLVRDWTEMNHSIFSALKLEKTVYVIVLLLIVLVAAFNIVATLIMVVMEKRKDIAILKSMGATRAGIAQIFLFKGGIIGGIGTLLGSAGGYLICWALQRYQFVKLPEGVFYVDTLPVRMYPEYFALIVIVSLAICLLASIYPARQAARLVPVDVIRYE